MNGVMRIGNSLMAYVKGKMYKKNFHPDEVVSTYQKALELNEEGIIALLQPEDSPIIQERKDTSFKSGIFHPNHGFLISSPPLH